MTPDRWQQLENLYAAYLGQPPSERATFLRRACVADPALRAEFESLLAADRQEDTFLGRSLVGFAGAPEAEPGLLEAGTFIGPYRLVRPIGRGGMAQVYLAVREAPFRQDVALKVIRRGLDTDDLLSRFSYERQILAALDHPHIARLYDGGMTPDGRPYFVMEYVNGVPITDYCDAQCLSTHQRLALFRTVCRAVHYAHRNLVVHRDLKPSNILVSEDGAVKLLDFGIAKLLDEERLGSAAPFTRTGLRLMTPEYASPEQVKGEAITTATDVYQLGILLYELLTGRRPYRWTDRVRREMERMILEEEPTRPSTAIQQTDAVQQGTQTVHVTPEAVSRARGTTVDALRRRLSGDLDMIVLMALRKEADRRYASVEQMNEDVRRHLAGLPVVARADTVRYRVGKFIRRHRFGVAVAGAFVLVLAGFSVVTALQSARIRTQAEEVALERDKAEQVIDFLVNLFESSDPMEARGDTITAQELVARGSVRIQEELGDQPAVQATMMNVLGRVHRRLGNYEDAERLARQVVALQRAAYGEEHEEAVAALIDLGGIRRLQGDYQEAESLYREAVALGRSALGADHLTTAAGLHGLARLLLDRSEAVEEAETLAREALAIRRRALGPDHPDVASSLQQLASVLRIKKAYDEAEVLIREALQIKRTVYGDEHLEVATSLNGLAQLLTVKRDYDTAEPVYREALGIYRRQLGDEHPYVATVSFNLGRLLMGMRDFAASEAMLRHTLALRRKHLGNHHPSVASTALQLGRVLVLRGRADQAEPLLRETVAIREDVLDADNWRTFYARVELGICLMHLRRYEEAEALIQSQYDHLEALLGPTHVRVQQARDTLAYLNRVWDKEAL